MSKNYNKGIYNYLPHGYVRKLSKKQKAKQKAEKLAMLEAQKKAAEEEAARKAEEAAKKAEEKRIAAEKAAAEKARLKEIKAAEKKERKRQEKIHTAPPSKKWKHYYSTYHMTEEIVDNWVLYESSGGIGMVCNPNAIFKAFMKRADFGDYCHIWVVKDEDERDRLSQTFSEYENVKFIFYGSRAYGYYLAKAKYLINNTSFPGCFSKKEGQVYIDTWHSITVKYLGYDVKDGNRLTSNMNRNLLMSDYILSPQEFMTKIFDESFRLKNIYSGKYIQEGFPRNDLLFSTKPEEIISKLSDRGIEIDRSKKIILYAPTWTGNKVSNPIIKMKKYTEFYERLKNEFGEEYQILVKPHQIVYKKLSDEEKALGLYVPYNIDTNELLSIVDILVTDYSSIYFDYLPTKRPILFYIPDYDDYNSERGIYFTLEELPGPYSYDLDGIVGFIKNIDDVKEKYAGIMEETAKWACKYDNGHVSEKILDIIIDGNEAPYNILTAKKEDKKTILIYPGGLFMDGVTSAFLSLSKQIDYEKFDVTLFSIVLKNSVANRNFDKLPNEIRGMVRCGYAEFSSRQKDYYNELLEGGFDIPPENVEMSDYICKREYMRCFGDTKFDFIIDFSGYGSYFPAICAKGCPSAKLMMWQHNDLKLDFENIEKRMLNNAKARIEALTSIYPYCYKVVSASEAIFETNRTNLSTPETYDKFTYCQNLIDEERIESSINEHLISNFDGKNYLRVNNELESNGIISTKLIPLFEDEDRIVFSTMGRCMPEKNHANIISAIKMLRDKGYNACLYIIGDGHIRPQLEEQIEELGLTGKVIITGFVENPFSILKESSCFVFPSLYEAQGLAVLEARMVNLPIIVSNYPAVKSVLIEDKQYILKDTSPESILDGMLAYINGEIPSDYDFDLEEYNKKAYNDFKNLIN